MNYTQTGMKRRHNKPFSIDGCVFRSLKEASLELYIPESTIKGRLINVKNHNYTYI